MDKARPRYPGGLKKALTFSYDDGQVHDRRLVALLNRHGLRGTFHLNSGTLGVHDDIADFIAAGEVASLYAGHEVACHGVRHLYPTHLAPQELVAEIWEDRRALEGLVDGPITGYSYAFGEYSPAVMRTLADLGIEYARTVEATGTLAWPAEFMAWHPTCHHDRLAEAIPAFLDMPHYAECPLLYVWGHSFEFERGNGWDEMEAACARLAGLPGVWYATNIEIKRYICAVRALQYSVDGARVYNPSAVAVWLAKGEALAEVAPGVTLEL